MLIWLRWKKPMRLKPPNYFESIETLVFRKTKHLIKITSVYFHIEPGNTVIGGGFFGPNPADLKHIRNQIAADDKPLRKILKNATFKKYFGTLQGNQVKTSPKGFDKEHPAIDLIRYKQFYVFRTFTDKEVTSPDFMKEVVKTSKAFRKFFDYMSDILTTDLNGESLL